MNRSPSSSIWRVCPFPHFFWPKGRVAAHSLLQTLPYPTHRYSKFIPACKAAGSSPEVFQVTFAEPVKCHDRILKSCFIGLQHKPYNNIQVRIRQFFHGKNCSNILAVPNDQIRRKHSLPSILLKQKKILRMALFDVCNALVRIDLL